MIQICFKLRLLMIFCSTMFLQVNEMLHCYTDLANCTMFHETLLLGHPVQNGSLVKLDTGKRSYASNFCFNGEFKPEGRSSPKPS